MRDTERPTNWAPLDFRAMSAGAPEGLFDTVFEESDAGLMILDLATQTRRQTLKIADANHAFERWTGMSRTKLRGRSFFALFDPKDHASNLRDLRQAITALQPIETQLALKLDGGIRRSFLVRVQPVGKDNAHIRFLVTFRLASEVMAHALKEAERQREKALQLREAFLQRMNHDLRTPLNGILGFSDLMKRELLGPLGQEQYRTYVEDIHSAGCELLGRLDDLLAVKDSSYAVQDMAETSFDPAVMLSDCLESVEASSNARHLCIAAKIAPGLPDMRGDLPAIRRAICAVLMNAIAASPKSGLIQVVFGANDKAELSLDFYDDGPTVKTSEIAESIGQFGDAVPDVFSSPSHRVSVGLALAKAVIERHGGTLEAGKVHYEGASRCHFKIRFPVDRLKSINMGQSLPSPK